MTVPYGYEKYRLDNGISPNTVVHEVRLIKNMLNHINHKYKTSVPPHEIRPIDIKDFLDNQSSAGLENSTIQRKLSCIRQWFNFMWLVKKIPIDYMTKFKYEVKTEVKPPAAINFNYNELLNIKPLLLRDFKLTLTAKLLFVFYMKGLRLRDIVQIEIINFEDLGECINLKVILQNGFPFKLKFTEDEEIAVLLSGIERSLFRGSPYLFSSKIKDEYVALRMGSVNDYNMALSKYTGISIRSEEIRIVYVHFLYSVKKMNIEDIQAELGISLDTTVRLLKQSLERLSQVDYNVKNG